MTSPGTPGRYCFDIIL
uniref:Uncharacterized protein n=1 Tax=Arundo donax TaxID=35708 RepID=A0A0A9EFZ0_ARUDO